MEAKIKPQDLRIGNYYYDYGNRLMQVDLRFFQLLHSGVEIDEIVKSFVPLSEDILKRFGFEETNKVAKRLLLKMSEKGFRHIQLSLAEVGNNPKWYASSEGFFLKTLYAAHDLQNLVYQLSGSELTIKDINIEG